MCLSPQKFKTSKDTVPCGKCSQCRARRVSGWSFRLMQEGKNSISSHFITLTYDTRSVPITKRGFMALSVRDVQLFFRRLRKANADRNIKYYLCGEYGGQTNRPHYHIILFNARIESIQKAWNRGYVHYGKVSGASIGYTLKYLDKPKRFPLFKGDDRRSEFSLMSKGIGRNYLTQRLINWHRADIENRSYCVMEQGQKISMPRYYRDKIYSEKEKESISSANLTRNIKKEEVIYAEMEFEVYKFRQVVKKHDMQKQLLPEKKNKI